MRSSKRFVGLGAESKLRVVLSPRATRTHEVIPINLSVDKVVEMGAGGAQAADAWWRWSSAEAR